VALIRAGHKNGNAPVFHGVVTTTRDGHSRLTGVTRFATGTLLALLGMVAVPSFILVLAVVDPSAAPAGGAGFALLVLVLLALGVSAFAQGAVEPTRVLHERLRRLAAADEAAPPAT
jgi:hypothetical protein